MASWKFRPIKLADIAAEIGVNPTQVKYTEYANGVVKFSTDEPLSTAQRKAALDFMGAKGYVFDQDAPTD